MHAEWKKKYFLNIQFTVDKFPSYSLNQMHPSIKKQWLLKTYKGNHGKIKIIAGKSAQYVARWVVLKLEKPSKIPHFHIFISFENLIEKPKFHKSKLKFPITTVNSSNLGQNLHTWQHCISVSPAIWGLKKFPSIITIIQSNYTAVILSRTKGYLLKSYNKGFVR